MPNRAIKDGWMSSDSIAASEIDVKNNPARVAVDDERKSNG